MRNLMQSNVRIFFLFLFFSINNFNSFSHNYIKGKVVNQEGELLSYASISEFLIENDEFITTIVSDTLGCFIITPQGKPSYLNISSLGYKPQKIDLTASSMELLIQLEVDEKYALSEVVVKAQRSNIKMTDNGLLCNLSSNPFKNDNLIEVFKFLPLMKVSNESFEIIGKRRTEIYINGRKSRLTGEALKSYLSSLPAIDVESIEVIIVPNSTFKGEGDFGVLNIRLKKKNFDGVRGQAVARLSKTHFFKENVNVSLNYQSDKIESLFSAGFMNASDWKKSVIESTYKNTDFHSFTDTKTEGHNQDYFANLALDYHVTSKQILGFAINSSLLNGSWSESGETKFSQTAGHSVDSLARLVYNSKFRNPQITANLNYRYNIDKFKHYVYIDIDYLNNNKRQRSKNIVDYFDEENFNLQYSRKYEQIAPQKANLWSGRVEYGNRLFSSVDLKIGSDVYYSEIDNDDKYNELVNGSFQMDTLKSNYFEIKEFTTALFINTKFALSKKFSTTLGARIEYTRYDGIQHRNNERFVNDYFRFLPNLLLGWQPAKNHQVSYSLSTRISRPSFKSLNPFIVYTSPMSYTKGNPDLHPSLLISQGLQYVLMNKYYLSVTYDDKKDVIYLMDYIKDDNQLESTPINWGRQKDLKFIFHTSFSYWNQRAALNINAAYIRSQSKSPEEDIAYCINALNIGFNNYYQLSEKGQFSFDWSLDYSSKQRYSYINYPAMLDMNMQFRKKIGMWNLSLGYWFSSSVYDGKISLKSKKIYDKNDLRKIEYKWGESSGLNFTVRYNFGNKKVKGLNERRTSNSDVKSRIIK